VERAVTWAIANHKSGFWPPLAVVVEQARVDHKGWHDALGIDRLREETHTDPHAPAVMSDAEQAYRAEVIRRAHVEHADFFARAASDDARATLDTKRTFPMTKHVSHALEAWARKHGKWTGDPDPAWRTREGADVIDA
jgi:hypothetical protein